MNGCVFSIEEFSIYDGPGIRTTVFLKGCPLRCEWCHNPEGQERSVEIIRSPNGCTGCNKCVQNAKKDNGKIVYTESSIISCPMNLLRYSGKIYDSDILCKKLLKNKPILQDGGGITFSGGEPLAQSDFLFECLGKLKGELHTAIQTSGYCEKDVFSKAIFLADHILFDIKIANDKYHKQYTGVSNKKIIENLSVLSKSKTNFTIRIPLIPSITDTYDNIKNICELLTNNNIEYAELLPYNKFAGSKYTMLGRTYNPDFDETATPVIHSELFSKYGIQTKIL